MPTPLGACAYQGRELSLARMHHENSRETAAAVLLERALPDLEAFAGVPPYLRARAARRAAVRHLADAARLSPLEQGALVRAASCDGDVQVRALAVAALGRLAPASVAIPVLIACTADGDAGVRDEARKELARLESSETRVVELVRPVVAPADQRLPRFIGH
jgi:hypothetical protein